MTVQDTLDALNDQLRTVAEEIARHLMPPVVALAEEWHCAWFEMQPWWRRWWHTMTGHRS